MSGFRNWLRARPWRIWPLAPDGYRYHVIYRVARQGSRHPRTGRWLVGGEPKGRIGATVAALRFPHVHDGGAEG